MGGAPVLVDTRDHLESRLPSTLSRSGGHVEIVKPNQMTAAERAQRTVAAANYLASFWR